MWGVVEISWRKVPPLDWSCSADEADPGPVRRADGTECRQPADDLPVAAARDSRQLFHVQQPALRADGGAGFLAVEVVITVRLGGCAVFGFDGHWRHGGLRRVPIG